MGEIVSTESTDIPIEETEIRERVLKPLIEQLYPEGQVTREVQTSHSDAEVTQRLRLPQESRQRRNSGGSVSLQDAPKPQRSSSGKKRSHSHHHHRHRRSRSADIRQPIVVARVAAKADDVTKAMMSAMDEQFNKNKYVATQAAPTEKTPLKQKPELSCCASCCQCCSIS